MTHDPLQYLPLVSPRSPSYTRARKEIDAGASTASISVAGLNRLVEMENDARRVCDHIASDIEDPGLRELTARLAIMHSERAWMVGDMVRWLGGSAPSLEASLPILRFGPSHFEGLSEPTEVRAALHRMYSEIRNEYLRQITELDLNVGIRHALQDLCPSPDGSIDSE